ncbi:SRPBCC domain-containing protein [Nocardioides daejeonensis]|uniref:SRPBCC domain-containing protein n=1 Tax=Nocardioides daejeonensis TaxID=1046556 RepID=UPI000D746EAA|nr:SRPBCC domain-containing protein [Nocardioides daejeonensis]
MTFGHDHEIEIDAPAATVWQVLTDFDAYREWNPFATSVRCDFRPGGAIDMEVAMGRRKLRQREFINTIDEGIGFSYSMKPAPGGLLRSVREQQVVDLGDGRSRYTSRFEIAGPLSPVVGALLGRSLRAGFDGNVAALKARAESL